VSLVPGRAIDSAEVMVKTSPTIEVGMATFSSLTEVCFFCLAFLTSFPTSSGDSAAGKSAVEEAEAQKEKKRKRREREKKEKRKGKKKKKKKEDEEEERRR